MQKPNILFMLVDDLGWGDVSYHSSMIKTPNIDKLAQRGIELDQHYVCPLCTPSRASLLTGKYPGRFGKQATVPSNQPVLPDGYRTLGTMFRDAGYATGLFGKWHLGADPKFYPGEYGFDYSYGSLAGGIDPYTHRYKFGQYSHTWHRNGQLLEEEGHATDLITNEAINWISKQTKGGKLWFCYVPFTAVHTPIRAPEQWIAKYWNQKFDNDPERDRSFKIYAGYVSHLDYAVGQFIENLKCSGQLDNSIVVLTSDNGAVTWNPSEDTAKYPGRHEDMPRTGSNYPLRGHKAQLYEGGIRVPGIVSWPGYFQKRKIDEPVQIVDWMPTFASILGDQSDSNYDGKNILPLLEGDQKHLADRQFYWNLNHNRFALRYGDWKLIYRLDRINFKELYNLDEDPLEEKNIASENPEIHTKLLEMIAQQRKLDDSEKRDDVK